MKRTILLLAFGGVLFSAKAQTINFQAGTTISHLNWELRGLNIRSYHQNMIGYSFFVGLDYFNTKYINLSSNLGLIRKGGMMEVEILDVEGQSIAFKNDRATLDYLSVNTLVDLKYPIHDKLIPFLSVGPRVDYLINSSKHFEVFNNQDQMSNVKFGLLTGAGIKYALAKSTIGIRFDYYTDFNNVANFSEPNQAAQSEVRAKMFSLNVLYGYSF